MRGHEHGSLWQSLERKTYVEACGKQTRLYVTEENDVIVASALVIIDTTTGGYSVWEIPRGPLLSERWKVESGKYEEFLQSIIADAKANRCIELLLSPVTPLPANPYPLLASSRHVHAEATRILDLTKSEEHILAQMHQKGRYNINLARKHGIEVAEGSNNDIDAFYDLLRSTGGRDGFKISQKSHYTRFLSEIPHSFLLLAKHQGKAIAGLIGVRWGTTGIYYYGASSYEHRHLMAPYLIQWEAIRRCKAEGCTHYDLLGISPEPAPANDPWLGISDFKRKFGGVVVTYPQEQALVFRPIMKAALQLKRKFLG